MCGCSSVLVSDLSGYPNFCAHDVFIQRPGPYRFIKNAHYLSTITGPEVGEQYV